MSGRQGGKLKPLKAPKKETKIELDEDIEFKKKLQAEKAALAKARVAATKGGPLTQGGIKKSK